MARRISIPFMDVNRVDQQLILPATGYAISYASLYLCDMAVMAVAEQKWMCMYSPNIVNNGWTYTLVIPMLTGPLEVWRAVCRSPAGNSTGTTTLQIIRHTDLRRRAVIPGCVLIDHGSVIDIDSRVTCENVQLVCSVHGSYEFISSMSSRR